MSRNGQGSGAVPAPSVPGRVRFAPSRRMLKFGRGVSLAHRESCADFPEVSLQLLDPSEWRLVAYGDLFREEKNSIVLEARSILYAVRYAESRYSPGRFLILSDTLALVLSTCKRR